MSKMKVFLLVEVLFYFGVSAFLGWVVAATLYSLME